MKKFVLVFITAFFLLTTCLESDKIQAKSIGEVPVMESVKSWKSEYGRGLQITTVHYEIFTTLLDRDILRRIPTFMESAYNSYNEQLPGPVVTDFGRTKHAVIKFRIYLFGDRQQWENFTRDFAGEQAQTYCAIKAGAYCHNGTCVAYDIGPKRTLSVLGHEGWHQFNGRYFKFRLPSWLDEGVAMLFEEYREKDGTFYFEPTENSYRLGALKNTMLQNRTIPLDELIVMNPGDVLASDQTEDVMAFYSQSYALVRFLREAGQKKRLGVYQRLLADSLYGNWPLDDASKDMAADRNVPRTILWNHIVGLSLFQEYVGYDLKQIDKEYLAFCIEITNDQSELK
jgi:hypothetical protein